MVEHRTGWLDPVFVGLTVIGYAGLVWIALAPVLAFRFRLGVLYTTAVTAAAVWTSDLVANALKLVFDRPRPPEVVPEADPLLGGTLGDSFPSGHAATAFAGATILALIVRRYVPWLLALAALIAFSRVYVGVHYPFDLVGGAVIGIACAAGVAYAVRTLRWPSRGPPSSAGAPPAG